MTFITNNFDIAEEAIDLLKEGIEKRDKTLILCGYDHIPFDFDWEGLTLMFEEYDKLVDIGFKIIYNV